MNFNTRIVLDLISLSTSLQKSVNHLIDEQLLLSNGIEEFTDEFFVDKLTPNIKELLEIFLKKELNDIGLGLIKKYINIHGVEYDILINKITEI